jgi:hypothetical protein
MIKSFQEFTGVQHSTTHPYSHKENEIVERANKEVILIRHLIAMVADKDIKKNWSRYLPYIQRIMNTLVKLTDYRRLINRTNYR